MGVVYFMKSYIKKAIALIVILTLTACATQKQITTEPGGEKLIKSKCPDSEVEWVDFVMMNDIMYYGEDEELREFKNFEKGEKIGEVTFKLADVACSNHRSKNGHAAYLKIGTPIYEMVGYNKNFRIIAGDKVYQVSENKKAKTISELLDIEGKAVKLSLESTYDGKHLLDFTEQEKNSFIEEYLHLKHVGFSEIYKSIIHDEDMVFLRIHLEDGSSFGISYWLKSNALNPGAYGTENMKSIVESRVNEL